MVLLTPSYYGADIRTTPTSAAQNGCHGNTGCLATGPRILHLMIEYVENAKAYKLQNTHTFIKRGSWSHDPILVLVGQRSRSYGHIIYSGKMRHNSITGGHVNFILGDNMKSNPQRVRHKMVAMGLMTSLTTYCSILNISNWCTCSRQGPCDVANIILPDTATRYPGCKFTNNL